MSKTLTRAAIATTLVVSSTGAYADFNHSTWDQLLGKHVTMTKGGKASIVDYNGMKADQAKLDSYLAATGKVSRSAFNRLSKDEQLAFLINVYNAATVDLVLTKYPKIKSIKDIGGVFGSPWKQDVVTLLGKPRTLDEIEHTLIRGSGRYNEPRIHFAVNCASIGCPALRDDAYTGRQLDAQLERATRQFLADRSRNRLKGNSLEVSPLFKWYKKDFESNWRGTKDLQGFLARYSTSLGLTTSQSAALKNGNTKISYTPYNWNLNQK